MEETPNDRLRLFRIEELDISQKEMAKTLDIQQGSYSDIERGRVGVNGILTKLIKTFRMNPIWLVEGFGKRKIEDVDLLFQEDEFVDHNSLKEDENTKNKVFELIDEMINNHDQELRSRAASELKGLFGKLLIEDNKKLAEISELKSMIIDLLRKRENLKEIIKKL